VIPRSSSSYVLARLRRPIHLLQSLHWGSLRTPEVAPATYTYRRRARHRFQASFRRMMSCIFWRLGFRQSSFRHITRIPQHPAPYAWTWPLLFWQATVPVTLRIKVSHQTQKPPSEFLPAPLGIYRGASWRRQALILLVTRHVADLDSRPRFSPVCPRCFSPVCHFPQRPGAEGVVSCPQRPLGVDLAVMERHCL
jgi:hypothetical protein